MYKQIWDYIKARYLGEKGQSVIEYTLLIGVVVAAIYFLTNDQTLGTNLTALWASMTGKIPDAVASDTINTSTATTGGG